MNTTIITVHRRLSELEAGEWRDFSEKLSDFKAIGAQVGLGGSLSDIRLALHIVQVVGVCTDSHVTVRTMLMNSAELKVPQSNISHRGSCC